MHSLVWGLWSDFRGRLCSCSGQTGLAGHWPHGLARAQFRGYFNYAKGVYNCFELPAYSAMSLILSFRALLGGRKVVLFADYVVEQHIRIYRY
jgi:hypothetical protein